MPPNAVQLPSYSAKNPRTIEHGIPTRLLRKPVVLDRVGFSKSELYRRIKSGKFPAPIKLGARAVAWRESDVDAWMAALAAGQASTN